MTQLELPLKGNIEYLYDSGNYVSATIEKLHEFQGGLEVSNIKTRMDPQALRKAAEIIMDNINWGSTLEEGDFWCEVRSRLFALAIVSSKL